jgi:hypothetical protein
MNLLGGGVLKDPLNLSQDFSGYCYVPRGEALLSLRTL